MNAVPPPPAGWYPDPSGLAPFRYWEGSRWTEHTDQGTASPRSVSPPSPPVPAAYPVPPSAYAATASPVHYASVAPVIAPQPNATNWTIATFIADLKKLDGLALVVVGGVLFFAFSFLAWTSETVSGVGFDGAPFTQTAGANGWEGEGIWLIRGWDVTENNVRDWANGISPGSGSDMVVLLPIALIAVGTVAASRLGRRITHASKIALGASGLLAVLMIAEAFHVNAAIDDVNAILSANGFPSSGGVSFGMYLSIMAALVMAVGAAKAFLAARNSAG